MFERLNVTGINIIGAGLAGLLAANMLRHRNPVIYEVQPSLPNNHSAVLRFRTPAVGDVLNIPFREVTMIKDHVPWRNVVADALAYSFKNSGKIRSDRSIVAGQTSAKRWIAPPDLIPRMAERCDIRYNIKYGFAPVQETSIISTLPMPVLMEILGYHGKGGIETSDFNYVPGINIKATIEDCDAYVSLLIPDPNLPFSRISITGNELIIECSAILPVKMIKVEQIGNNEQKYVKGAEVDQQQHAESCVRAAADLLGIDFNKFHDIKPHNQKYAKITPVPDEHRKSFMFWATDTYNIYSLGRFATWRPGLLLDDLIQDIRHIDRWLSAGRYAVARHR